MIRFTSVIWMSLIYHGCDETPREAARESTQTTLTVSDRLTRGRKVKELSTARAIPAFVVSDKEWQENRGQKEHVRDIVNQLASDSGVYKGVCDMTGLSCTNSRNISQEELIDAISKVYPQPNTSAEFLAALVGAHNAISAADRDNHKVLQALALELVFEILLSITRHSISEPPKSPLLHQITHLLNQIKSPETSQADTITSTQQILNLAPARPAEQREFMSGLLILVQLSQMALVDTTSSHILRLIEAGHKELTAINEKEFDPKDFSEAVYHAKLQAILGRSGSESQRSISTKVLGDLYASLNLLIPVSLGEEDEEEEE